MKGEAAPEAPRPRAMLHEPNLAPLSAVTAAVGMKLYNAAGVHEATIAGVDLAVDRITVRYVKNGARELKSLSGVSRWWYVKQ